MSQMEEVRNVAEKDDKRERMIRYDKRSQIRVDIKNDLLEQLQERNILESHFIDLVNDYLSLWDVKSELIYDIEEKGVSLRYQNGANQWGFKKNDSVAELNRVNGQMLTILRELGLKPEAKMVDDDDANNFEL